MHENSNLDAFQNKCNHKIVRNGLRKQKKKKTKKEAVKKKPLKASTQVGTDT